MSFVRALGEIWRIIWPKPGMFLPPPAVDVMKIWRERQQDEVERDRLRREAAAEIEHSPPLRGEIKELLEAVRVLGENVRSWRRRDVAITAWQDVAKFGETTNAEYLEMLAATEAVNATDDATDANHIARAAVQKAGG